MIRQNPSTILRFLAEHYSILRCIQLAYQQQPIGLKEEELRSIKGASELLSRLLQYRVLELRNSLGQERYHVEEHYAQFLTFLARDFSLDFPSQLAKYGQALSDLYAQLKQAEEEAHIQLLIRKIMEEVSRLITHLDDNTLALEKEADDLRSNQNNGMNYRIQIERANYLIDTFLQPLNHLLTHKEGSMSFLLQEMKFFGHQKTIHALDSYARLPFQALVERLQFAEERVQKHLSKVIHSLLPLIEQIRLTNQVLQGLKRARELFAQKEEQQFRHFLPSLVERKQHATYSFYREGNAAEHLLEHINRSPVVVQDTTSSTPLFQFPRAHYRNLLEQALPINNFYGWCQQTLKKDYDNEVDQKMFFKLASFLLDRNFAAQVASGRYVIDLQDVVLTVPHINLDHAVSNPT